MAAQPRSDVHLRSCPGKIADPEALVVRTRQRVAAQQVEAIVDRPSSAPWANCAVRRPPPRSSARAVFTSEAARPRARRTSRSVQVVALVRRAPARRAPTTRRPARDRAHHAAARRGRSTVECRRRCAGRSLVRERDALPRSRPSGNAPSAGSEDDRHLAVRSRARRSRPPRAASSTSIVVIHEEIISAEDAEGAESHQSRKPCDRSRSGSSASVPASHRADDPYRGPGPGVAGSGRKRPGTAHLDSRWSLNVRRTRRARRSRS